MNAPPPRGSSRTWPTAVLAAATAFLVGGLAGCGGASTASVDASGAARTAAIGDGGVAALADGTVALVGEDAGGSSMTAQVRGRLIAHAGGCALLDDGSGALQLLVLEHGTTAAPDGSAFISPDGVVVRDGDGIRAVGGFLATVASGARQVWPSAPAECFGADRVARVVDGLQLDPTVIAEQLAAFGHREEYADGTLLLVPREPPNGAADALTGGVLTRLEGGCLGLSSPDGYRQLVKWPYGSVWDPQQQVLTVPEQGRVSLAKQVALGGGQGLADWLKPALPGGCVYDDFWTAS